VKKLPNASATSSQDYLASAAGDLAALCTACGRCFDACPLVDTIGLRSADGKAVTNGLALLARGEAAPEATVAWVGACGKSGLCIAACPERDKGLNAMMLVRIARQQAIVTSKQLPAKHDPAAFPRVKTFARLQLTDEEQKKWL
jgi:Fe-S oxidoreductase